METTLSGTLETQSESQPISVQIVRKIAEQEGTDPTSLDTPLYDVINPEALNELFEPRRNGEQRYGTVEFTYHGYHIVVEGDDGEPTITLEAQGEQPSASSELSARSDAESVADASHYCLDCDWSLPDDAEHSTSDRSGLAIDHHVETGHTIEANEASAEPGQQSELLATDDSAVRN